MKPTNATLRSLEEALALQNIPSYALVVKKPGQWDSDEDLFKKANPIIDLVIPMKTDGKVVKFLHQYRTELNKRLGPKYYFRMRSIIYHLAYTVFGSFSDRSKESHFLSTTVTNHSSPRKESIQIGGTAYPCLVYDVEVVAVATQNSAAAHRNARLWVETAANDFNKKSRFLKIGSLSVGFTPTPFIWHGQKKPSLQKVALNEWYLGFEHKTIK